MNKEQKAAVIEEVAAEIGESQAVIAVDYRGISVKQAGDLRVRLGEAGATFRVVKNTLTERAADKAGTAELKELLEGPTAFAFVRGDAALAAKALATFRRETQLLEFKGGIMDGRPVTSADIESIARLPARDVLYGQFVGVLASPITGLVRGLSGLISGLASQLGQIRDGGMISGGEGTGEHSAGEEPAGDGPAAAADGGGEEPSGEEEPSEAPGDPVAEAAAIEEELESQTEGAPETGDQSTEQES